MTFWAVVVLGWTLILTRSDGPGRCFARLRAAWPGSPLGCVICTGAWVGALFQLSHVAEERVPFLEHAISVAHAMGAAAAVGWFGVQLADLIQHTAERQALAAWNAANTGDKPDKDKP